MKNTFEAQDEFKRFLSPNGTVYKDKPYTNTYSPGSVAEFPHNHTFWELFLLHDGTAIHQWNYKSGPIQAGDLILIKPTEYHWRKNCTGTYTDLYIHATLFKTACDLIHPYLFAFFSSIDASYVHLEGEQLLFCQTQLQKLHKIQDSTDNTFINVVYIPIIFNFVSFFAEKYFVNKTEEDIEFYNFLSKINIQEYICGPLENLVEASHYSHGYLCKIFKDRMEKTLKQYHNELKINYAIELLQDKNLSILDISNKLGYSSLSHFIQVFKNFTNKTPKQYQNFLQHR